MKSITTFLITSYIFCSSPVVGQISESYDVQEMKQPYDWACWATSYTMLYSWKQNVSIEILDALGNHPSAATYVQKYNDDKGLNGAEAKTFWEQANLSVEPAINPSIQGWATYLKDGPLLIVVEAVNAVHAIVMTGMNGNGSPNGTTVTYIDPADGLEYTKPFTEFVKIYEGAEGWPGQIVHY